MGGRKLRKQLLHEIRTLDEMQQQHLREFKDDPETTQARASARRIRLQCEICLPLVDAYEATSPKRLAQQCALIREQLLTHALVYDAASEAVDPNSEVLEAMAEPLVRALNAVGDSTVILADDVEARLYEAWRNDEEKVAWCYSWSEQNWSKMYEEFKEVDGYSGVPSDRWVALDQHLLFEGFGVALWLAFDPFETGDWEVTPESMASLRTRQEDLLSRLASLSFSDWKPEAESYVAGRPFSWESQEQFQDREVRREDLRQRRFGPHN
jgi:hypothetical protein